MSTRVIVSSLFIVCLAISKNAALTAESTTHAAFPIRIVGPRNVTLPVKKILLEAVIDENDVVFANSTSLSYQWEVVSGSGLATATAYNQKQLVLTQLKAGQIVVRVTVEGQGHVEHAEHIVKITERLNDGPPPRAIIRPEGPIESVEGNTLTLDAEGSNVTALPATFSWVQKSGPAISLPATNVPSLRIEKLVKGTYKFTVTVTDARGRASSESVTVNVHEERDDPPRAHITECGSASAADTIPIRLPIDQLELCANTSQDDKGIVDYRWFRVDSLSDKLTVDMDGSTSPVLSLRNLQANEKLGPYEFQLDVLDEKKQKDSTKVSVFVHVARNLPPVAVAGGNRTVTLPESSLVLEGNAKDDGQIKSYNWKQESGPSNATILNADQAKATVSNLIEGDYVFKFTVVDDGALNGSDSTWVAVRRGQNTPPVAVAENVTVSLPISGVQLDGSKSHDDAGIVAYSWTPDDDVPAAISILGGSDEKSVLVLSRLVEGTFRFNFTVRDQQGEKDQQWVWLTVQRGDAENEAVELTLHTKIAQFTVLQRSKLENRIAAILSSGLSDVTVVRVHTTLVEEEPTTGRIRVVFWARAVEQTEEMRRRRARAESSNVIPAEKVVTALRADTSMQQNFAIETIEPKYCKLTCSDHGHCSDYTKECICDHFWMASLIGVLMTGGRHLDCGWSSIYFSIGSLLFCFVICYYAFIKRSTRSWTKKAKRLRFRRRRRYSPLHSDESEGEHKLRKTVGRVRAAPRLQPLPLPPSSDSLTSEADDLLPKSVHVSGSRDNWQSIELRERSAK